MDNFTSEDVLFASAMHIDLNADAPERTMHISKRQVEGWPISSPSAIR